MTSHRIDGSGETRTRRRGTALEKALLEACWQELQQVGYSGLTVEAVAKRARTSKPVIYRRWPTLPEFVLAALLHHMPVSAAALPDTGTMRGDLRGVLELMSRRLNEVLVALPGLLADFHTNRALFERMRAEVFGPAGDIMRIIATRAADRGEIPTAILPQRTLTAPIDLARYELLFNARPLDTETIESIIDHVAIPLLHCPPARKGPSTLGLSTFRCC